MIRRAALVLAAVLLFAGCDWTMFRGGPAHTGYNPQEQVIGASNVAGLAERWQTADALSNKPPVAAGALQYSGLWSGDIAAYAADGTTNCAGTPKSCRPVWVGDVPVPSSAGAPTPTVVGGIAYVAAPGHVYAFDARGATNCTPGTNAGDPALCTPLWSGDGPGAVGLSTVIGGVLYVSAIDSHLHGYVYAFDAAGERSCSGDPKVCTPMWRGDLGGFNTGSPPAVANGLLYVSLDHQGKVRVFDAAGEDGCSGVPLTCQPLWIADTGAVRGITAPVVGPDGLFVVANVPNTTIADLYAFDAIPTSQCTGSPRTCTPKWTASGADVFHAPAVANHTVYLAEDTVRAYDARGVTNCAGTPKVCAPLWTSTDVHADSSPTVANGLVFAATEIPGSCFPGGCNHTRGLVALDAGGSTNCTPAHVCSPLWQHSEDATAPFGEPVVANGVLYVNDIKSYVDVIVHVHAFTLP